MLLCTYGCILLHMHTFNVFGRKVVVVGKGYWFVLTYRYVPDGGFKHILFIPRLLIAF